MFLTREEEAILNGEMGEGMRKAMELLVAMGDIKGAEKLYQYQRFTCQGYPIGR